MAKNSKHKHVAVRHIPRADKHLIEQLGASGCATVHEAQGRSGLMQPYLRPVYPGACLSGSAVTVLTQPGENLMLRVAIEL